MVVMFDAGIRQNGIFTAVVISQSLMAAVSGAAFRQRKKLQGL